MNNPAFPANIAAALDAYVVPPLPTGFSNRLLARLEAGDLPVVSASGDFPAGSPRSTRRFTPWLRPGRIFGSLAAISLVTATAAASGLLGERVYIPLVSDILVSAKIVAPDLPVPVVAKSKSTSAEAEPVIAPLNAPLTGQAAVRELWANLRSDPEFRALPPAEKAARIKAEGRALIASGNATLADIRAERMERVAERQQKAEAKPVPKIVKQQVEAWRERYERATPDEQAVMREEARRKRQERIARRRGEAVPEEEPVLSPIE